MVQIEKPFSPELAIPLSTRKTKLPKEYFRATWPTMVAAAIVGLCLALGFISIRWRMVSASWREGQLAIAKSDLLAIQTIFQLGGLAKTGSLAATGIELYERSQIAIELLAKEGELLWSIDSIPPASGEPQNRATDEMHAVWSGEPNGYNRLKLTCRMDKDFVEGNELTLVRRYSANESEKLSLWDWLAAVSLNAGLIAFGVRYAKRKYDRKQLLIALTEWSKQAAQNATSERVGTPNHMNSVDPSIAKILERASQSMQNRLETVQHSVEQSSRVMSAMPVGVLAFDQKLKLLFVNRAGRELLGLGASFQFGQNLIEVIRQPTVVNLIQQVSMEPQIQEVELELPLSKLTLRLRAHPLSEPGQNKIATTSNGVLLTVTDETRLRQLENARRDFTANVSHELKTPLSAIKAYAETLLMGALEDEEASQRFVERIAEQANRLDSLIRDLLHLTKLQTQPDQPVLSDLLLDDVLKTCVEEHRSIGQAKKIAIDTTGVERDCRVEADLESLRTVIGNLLGNAVRYNQSEGWVKVSTRRESQHVVLIIADNGIGIPPEDLDRIFERFYRVEKARSQDSGGTGLGLSIVKHLVQGMSAEIRVSSILGEGSTFELKLNSAKRGEDLHHPLELQ
jgi:two-component system, OmpR family, phosphate regulon sensor histidine kinase PhoR